MQHVSAYGYPTPPASPDLDPKSPIHRRQQHRVAPQQYLYQQPYVPVAPEERLGKFLTSSLKLDGILGTGAYGVVYSAVNIHTNVRYAVKCLSKFNHDGTPLDRRQVAFQNREIRLHHLASAHPNVVSMLKIIDNVDCTYVILEYCPEGDLFFNITERGQYVGKDDLAKSVFLQVLDAVEHCHSLGIYHRDLKPENILVSDRGETVKLADFGLATSSECSEDYGCGSTFYMSPECLDQSARRPFYYCAPNDVWSLGVILVNLTCGRNPWKQASFEDSTYSTFTRRSDFLKTILPLSDELNDILVRIFAPNPDQRISLPELRTRILNCTRFTQQPVPVMAPLPSPPSPDASPVYVPSSSYVDCDESAVDDTDFDYGAALSPNTSRDSISDVSTCSSDDSSLLPSCPSSPMADLEEDDGDIIDEPPEVHTPPPQPELARMPPLNPGDPALYAYSQDFAQQPLGPVALDPIQQQQPLHMPAPQSYLPKFSFPFWGDMFSKYALPAPFQQSPVFSFHHHNHHQVHLFGAIPGY